MDFLFSILSIFLKKLENTLQNAQCTLYTLYCFFQKWRRPYRMYKLTSYSLPLGRDLPSVRPLFLFWKILKMKTTVQNVHIDLFSYWSWPSWCTSSIPFLKNSKNEDDRTECIHIDLFFYWSWPSWCTSSYRSSRTSTVVSSSGKGYTRLIKEYKSRKLKSW